MSQCVIQNIQPAFRDQLVERLRDIGIEAPTRIRAQIEALCDELETDVTLPEGEV
jgi:hypothetical protein